MDSNQSDSIPLAVSSTSLEIPTSIDSSFQSTLSTTDSNENEVNIQMSEEMNGCPFSPIAFPDGLFSSSLLNESLFNSFSPLPSIQLEDLPSTFSNDDTVSLPFCFEMNGLETPSVQPNISFSFDGFQTLCTPRELKLNDLSPSIFVPKHSEMNKNSVVSNTAPISFASTQEKTESSVTASCGILPRGVIHDIPLYPLSQEHIVEECEEHYPLPSVFDTIVQPLPDEPSVCSSTSFSSLDDSTESPKHSLKRKSKRKNKKWECSNCHYLNNIKTKKCLNCGTQSPFSTISSDSMACNHYCNSNSCCNCNCSSSDDMTINSSEEDKMHFSLSNPSQSKLSGDTDVGLGYKLKDFPYAFIPVNPYGENTEAAYLLNNHKAEPRICAHCGNTHTSKWRRFPTPWRFLLCNACGLQFSKNNGNPASHLISPLEECQGEYCVKARAQGIHIKRRLFNRRLCYYCNRLRRQALGLSNSKVEIIS